MPNNKDDAPDQNTADLKRKISKLEEDNKDLFQKLNHFQNTARTMFIEKDKYKNLNDMLETQLRKKDQLIESKEQLIFAKEKTTKILEAEMVGLKHLLAVSQQQNLELQKKSDLAKQTPSVDFINTTWLKRKPFVETPQRPIAAEQPNTEIERLRKENESLTKTNRELSRKQLKWNSKKPLPNNDQSSTKNTVSNLSSKPKRLTS